MGGGEGLDGGEGRQHLLRTERKPRSLLLLHSVRSGSPATPLGSRPRDSGKDVCVDGDTRAPHRSGRKSILKPKL